MNPKKNMVFETLPKFTIITSYFMSTPELTPTHLQLATLYDRVDLNPMPDWTLSPSQGLWIWPQAVLARAVIVTEYNG